jgi:hypothetical protein
MRARVAAVALALAATGCQLVVEFDRSRLEDGPSDAAPDSRVDSMGDDGREAGRDAGEDGGDGDR